jgi:FkbM family methyltransferase
MVFTACIVGFSAVKEKVLMEINNGWLFNLHSKVMTWCYSKFNSTNVLHKLAIKFIAVCLWLTSVTLQFAKRVKFPKRTLGSRFWIYQWRVEYLMGWWEHETTPWVRKLVKPGMTVIDIGAHIGYYSDLFSQLAQTHGRVHAFEASPENYPILVRNMEARRRTNVTAHHRALSDENGYVDLYVSPGHSNHSLVKGYTQAEKTVKVEAVRLDDYLPDLKMDFLKMDVEGSEPRVLNGMRRIINASPNLVMIVEYNRTSLGAGYPSPQILLDLLTELGFEYQAILDDGSLGEIPDDHKTYNLLCTRKNAA